MDGWTTYGVSVLMTSLPPRRMGSPSGQAPLAFGHLDASQPNVGRALLLAGEPAFELSWWCGTCPFLFRRLGGANGTLSEEIAVLSELEGPVDGIDERVLAPFVELVPEGDYLPLLLRVEPVMVAPHDELDYFAHEQVDTWGVDPFWRLPHDPRAVYYRTFETPVSSEAHLYEFVVPMVPPGWNERARVEHYRGAIVGGSAPTAVALSTLDVCAPAVEIEGGDYYAHWGLTHFLLDGHHKVEAAARAGAAIQLLSLVNLDDGVADRADVLRLPSVLAQPPGSRPRP